jgi:hypothetical protein
MRTRRLDRLLVPPALVLVALARGGNVAQSVSGVPIFRRVALTSDPAADTPPGVVFSEFGAVPGAGDDFPPRIDAQGNVVFHAVLSGTGVTGVSLSSGNGLGIWKSLGATNALVARQDAPAPGTAAGVEFMGFISALDTRPPILAAGRAAFLGGLRGPGVDSANFTDAVGIWTERPGGLQLAVRAGAPAPGLSTGNVFRLLDSPFLSKSGRILFNALWRAPGDSPSFLAPNQEGFWSDRSGSLAAVILAGEPAPGTAPGAVFRAETSTAIEGAFRGWDTNDGLRFAVNGNLGGPSVNDLNDEGIWVERAAGLTLLAREGELAPGAGTGVHFGVNNGIDTFGDVIPLRMNSAGAVLFGARLSGPNMPFMRSLWTDRSGSLDLVARGTMPLTGSAAGDPAPGLGPGWTFSALALVDFDAVGTIAFSGFATFQLDFDIQVAGLWWDQPGELALVAREGDPAPGSAPGVEFAGLNLFVSLADDGHLFFLSTLSGAGVTGSNDLALCGAEPRGTLHLIVREGALFDVSGEGSDLRTVVRIIPGDANGMGEIPFELVFAGGSSGLFTARFDGSTRPPHLRR